MVFAEKKDGVVVQDLAGSAGRLIAEIDEKTPVLIAGPTASGKSALAIELARRLGGAVINADSMQIYRGMDIGTAKLSIEERKGIPHHLLDVLDVNQDATVAWYQENYLSK